MRGGAAVVATAWTIVVVSGRIAAVVVGKIVVVVNGQQAFRISGWKLGHVALSVGPARI